MATFPAIEPDARSYDLAGEFPGEAEQAWPGSTVLYRTGSDPLTTGGLQMELGFLLLDQTDAQQIRDHYNGQMSGTIPFDLPAVITQGHPAALVPVNTRWRYVGEPSEDQRRTGRVDMTITLEADAHLAAE